MTIDQSTRDLLLKTAEDRGVYLEGNILKLIKAEPGDEVFAEYLNRSIERDRTIRLKRLEVTKTVQKQNVELVRRGAENAQINEELKEALRIAEIAKSEAVKSREAALIDLDLMQKKSQFELIGSIVKIALGVIISVGVTTTLIYAIALFANKDTQMIGSTWSNMLGILLTNAFSIVGTIMGVKYASNSSGSGQGGSPN
jgi:hypothetical protein